MANPVDPCQFLTGAVKTACQKAQQDVQNGGSTGGAIGADWWRHAVLRVVEVVVGVAMVVVGVKALLGGSDTVKVIVQGGKKVGSKI